MDLNKNKTTTDMSQNSDLQVLDIGVYDQFKIEKMLNIKNTKAIVTNSVNNFATEQVDEVTKYKIKKMLNINEDEAIVTNSIEDGEFVTVGKKNKKNQKKIESDSEDECEKIVYNRRQRKAYKKELENTPATKVEVCGVELCYMRTSNLPAPFVRNTTRKVVNIGGGTQVWRTNRKYDIMTVGSSTRSTTYKCNAQYKQQRHLETTSLKKRYCAICDTFFMDEETQHYSLHDSIMAMRKRNYFDKNEKFIKEKKKVNIVALMDDYNMEYQKKNKDGSFVIDEEEEIIITNPSRFTMMSDIGLHKWIMNYIENDSYLEKLFFLTKHKNDSLYSRIWKCIKSKSFSFSCNFEIDSEISDEFEDLEIDLPFDHFIVDIESPVNKHAFKMARTRCCGSDDPKCKKFLELYPGDVYNNVFDQWLYNQRAKLEIKDNFCYHCMVHFNDSVNIHKARNKHLEKIKSKDGLFKCYLCNKHMQDINDFSSHIEGKDHNNIIVKLKRMKEEEIVYTAQMENEMDDLPFCPSLDGSLNRDSPTDFNTPGHYPESLTPLSEDLCYHCKDFIDACAWCHRMHCHKDCVGVCEYTLACVFCGKRKGVSQVCDCRVYSEQGGAFSSVKKDYDDLRKAVNTTNAASESVKSFMDKVNGVLSTASLRTGLEISLSFVDIIVDILILKDCSSVPLICCKIITMTTRFLTMVGFNMANVYKQKTAQAENPGIFLKSLNSFNSFSAAIKNLDYIKDKSRGLMNWFFEHMPKGMQDLYINVFGESMERRLTRFIKIINLAEQGDIKWYEEEILELDEKLRSAFVFHVKSPQLTLYRDYVRKYTTLMNRTIPETRKVPFMLVFTGKPQIGKSTILDVVHELLERMDNEMVMEGVPLRKGMYTVTNSEFWDGVTKDVHTVKFDDLMQNKDCLDAMKVISLKTTAPFIPPLASLDNVSIGVKGTCIDPRLILGATNLSGFHVASTVLQDSNAFDQRIDLLIEAEKNKKEMKPGSVDHLDFKISRVKGDLFSGSDTIYTFEEIMGIIVEKYYEHHEQQKKITRTGALQESLIDRLRNIRGRIYNPKEKITFTEQMDTMDVLSASAGLIGVVSGGIMYEQATSNTMKIISTILTIVGSLWFGKKIVDDFKDKAVVEHRVEEDKYLKILRVLDIHDTTNIPHMCDAQSMAWLLKRKSKKYNDCLKDILSHLLKFPEQIRVTLQKEDMTVGEFLDIKFKAALDLHSESISQKANKTKKLRSEDILDKNSSDAVFSDVLKKSLLEYQSLDLKTAVKAKQEVQGMSDISAHVVHQAIIPCQFFFRLRKDCGNCENGTLCQDCETKGGLNAIHIASNFYLLPRHFFEKIDSKYKYWIDIYKPIARYVENEKIVDYTISRVKVLEFVDKNLILMGDRDMCLYYIPTMPMIKNSLQYFICKDELPYIKENENLIGLSGICRTRVGDYERYAVRSVSTVYAERIGRVTYDVQTSYSDKIQTSWSNITAGFSYMANTQQGDCGSLVILYNNNLQHKVTGIHLCGGSDGSGHSAIITQEMLKEYLPTLIKKQSDLGDLKAQGLDERDHMRIDKFLGRNCFNIECVGKIDKISSTPRKTEFYRTGLDVTPTKVPSDKSMAPDPLLIGVLQYGKLVPERKLDSWVENYIVRQYVNVNTSRILGIEEALNSLGKMNAVNLNTSMGYPYVLNGVKKRDVVDEKNGVYTLKSEYESEIKSKIEDFISKEVQVVYIMALKDELKEVGKLCRSFEIPPFWFTILTRMYFGSFIDMFHNNYLKFFSAIGMNPESSDWSRMINKLRKISPLFVDVDFKKYDKVLLSSVLNMAGRTANRWYKQTSTSWKEEDDVIRLFILRAIWSGLLLYGEFIFLVYIGMRSGSVLTAIFNTIGHAIMLLQCVGDILPFVYENNIDEVIQFILYGDDGLYSISPEYIDRLNRKTLLFEFQKNFLIVGTDGKKTGSIVEWDYLSNVTFLKRGFDLRDGVDYPNLDWLSLISMLNFVRYSKHVSFEEQLKFNIDVFSRFLYCYGPGVYSVWAKVFDLPSYLRLKSIYEKDGFDLF